MQKGNYNNEDRAFMELSAKARDASRLNELIKFLHLSGYKKIGIAACFSVRDMAQVLAEKLTEEGFEVVLANCKESSLEACELSPHLKGISCDPKAQSEYFNNVGTDFNINFGLCLGHGLLFQKYSKAPVTTMLVKDPCHKHNVAESFCS